MNNSESELYSFLNIKEASLFLKVSVPTVYTWVHQRKIPFRKHGSRLVFYKVDLINWSNRFADGESTLTILPKHPNFKPVNRRNSDRSLKTEVPQCGHSTSQKVR